ncbi:hypothetical protein [Larkinella sp. C7]|uniref:hypothetical protein n=1 Tax=Larkinella sp. C7 TaxID=2576607 RepID=UPI0014874BF6|nr:hypothetical protein [Larkinella sp. C7]
MNTQIQYILLAFLLELGIPSGTSDRSGDDSDRTGRNHSWTQTLESGPWKKSYNFQLFSHHDTLWVFHPDGTWFSVTGRNWQKSPLPNAIQNLAFLDYVQFNNTIIGLGHFEGNIENYAFQPVIYQTKDLKHWSRIAGPALARQSNLPRRFFYHPFVFQHKLWIIGGEDSQTRFADCWNSADGIVWKKVKDNLPFGQRSGSQVVQLKNKLYLLNNDVWSSDDGLNWKLVTPEIKKGVAIFGYTAVVLDDRIWLLGCNRNGQFTSNVLVSGDGKNWQEEDAPWSPRGGIAACVHRGKIYMTGGKYGGPNTRQPEFVYSNDVWELTVRGSE